MSMGKKRIGITDSLRDKWVEEHEKKSVAGNYEPFIRTQDLSSTGIRARVPCPYEPKLVYDTMSFNETLTLIDLLRDPNVVEIKEQFPFTDIEKSRAFAKELDIKHPQYMWSAVDSIITWDFLCTLITGKKRVVSVKPESELEDPRTLEKLALERVLAEDCGYEYIIVTDKQIRTEKIRNLIRVKRGATLPIKLEKIYSKWLKAFIEAIGQHQHDELSASIELLTTKFDITHIQSFTLMQHAFWQQDVVSDDTIPLRPESSPYLMGVHQNVQY
jgi:hypothetical protein